ncbi:hypothetical protein ACIA8G_04535 [Lentzea sp. NPDC051213]|uniref:hypothetical protein n=1 Tax=Lentzea sp. NPDC051213 TaxID=3364126 RepID=UPI0037B20ABA
MSEPSSQSFPPAGIDGFLSHFVFTVRVNKGDLAGQVFSYTWPAAVQTVVRSEPFIYEGPEANHRVEFALPKGADLPTTLSEEDFIAIPPGFFEAGKETIWLQILNLDARGETEYGPMRCILGATFKREYPDIFQASFGAAQSLGDSGLPARLFFNPNGIFETPFGNLHTRPKALLGTRVDKVPPVGSNPELLGPIALDSVDDLRAAAKDGTALPETPAASLLALAHPIDAQLQADEGELFDLVERAISRTA